MALNGFIEKLKRKRKLVFFQDLLVLRSRIETLHSNRKKVTFKIAVTFRN